ncbi:DUF6653 family protein [Haloarchaeobius amylolyticus]|uniref:DUF6653 family protein n=1 Tax=Haloarchaeobius amylolyticus TaxID=1198296 RepID=UPI00226FC861|nr:DUF6653 family protein [Haloarchaeobius amylolyticus]
MNVEKTLAKLFGLEGDNWLHHANPKSVYSRFPVLAMIAASVWSRIWIGEYFLVPLALTFVWTFLNPHLFDRPASLESWAARGVLGERIWKDRAEYEIPDGFPVKIQTLNALNFVGMVPYLYGLYVLDFWMMVAGFSVAFLSKLWFFDRMVWLYEELRHLEEVREWTA